MADYLQWMAACEPWPTGTFERAYDENKKVLAAASLEADTIAAIILDHILKPTNGWEGTAAALLAQIDAAATDQQKHRKEWPRTPHALAHRVRSAHEVFLAQGWQVTTTRAKTLKRDRLYRFAPAPTNIGEETSKMSKCPNDSVPNDLGLDIPLDDMSNQSSNGKPLKEKGFGQSGQLDISSPDLLGDDEPLCRRCGIPGNATFGQLIRGSHNGSSAHYHPRCWTEERTKGPYYNRAMRD
jgi:hypothetical protein